MKNYQKIAIIYDWFDKWGGVERVLLCLKEMFPQAVFYTSYYDRTKARWAKDFKIKTSFIDQFPDLIKKSRLLSLVFYPFAFESLDLSEYDLVISVTSSFAKSVVTRPGTKSICYLLTPTRYLWVDPESYFKNKAIKSIVAPYVKYLKSWDYITAQRPDNIISISAAVADRCLKYYKRESEIIFPPFDNEYWSNIKLKIINNKSENKTKKSKYYLLVARLEPYKKVDLAIETFNQLGDNLTIVGTGSQLNSLKKIAGKNIFFRGQVNDLELARLYCQAEALIMPQNEDFGYVSLESQFFGCPVIAYKKGGALETVIEGQTGLFFSSQTVRSLSDTIARFHTLSYNIKDRISAISETLVDKFSKDSFKNNILKIINN